MKSLRFSQRGFTLVELLTAMTVGLVVSGLAFSYLRTGTILLAKNVTTNFTNNEVRGSLDQIADRIQSAVTVPVLINTSGAETTSPAAGVYYDRLLGEPYVVSHPGGSGLVASATSVVLQRSTNAYASPPIPEVGDVVVIDNPDATLRPRISAVNAGTISAGLQSFTLTLAASLGTAITWEASQVKTAKLIRREALIMMPAGSRYQLRRYGSYETTTNLNDATKYAVISRHAGNLGTEMTPFSITEAGLDKLLNIDFRVRASGFENVLQNKEVSSFSNYMRVQCMIPSRQRPKN